MERVAFFSRYSGNDMLEITRPDLEKIITYLKQYSFELSFSTSPSSSYRKDAVDDIISRMEKKLRDE